MGCGTRIFLVVCASPGICVSREPGASVRCGAEESRCVVPEASAEAAGGPTAQVALGLSAGGDAVGGHRLCPGKEVEGGLCEEELDMYI